MASKPAAAAAPPRAAGGKPAGAPAIQGDRGSNASFKEQYETGRDRGALLQAIQAGTKLKHVQRASMLLVPQPQPIQSQQLYDESHQHSQQALDDLNMPFPNEGPAEPANAALLKAIQAGTQLRHVHRASMVQQQQRRRGDVGGRPHMTVTAASADSGRAALLTAIQAGGNGLHHVHRSSMVQMQQQR
jgi:hypothetical protein